MINLLLATLLTTIPPQEQIDRFCAYVVGIPYGTDNFTDQEWKRLQFCRQHLIVPNHDYT